MKKILNLTGVQKLSKEQQQEIKGAIRNYGCCNSQQCRVKLAGGAFGCEYSLCIDGFCQYLY
ncbi:hypothetical protein [Aquimarina algiphila]|uniref:Uncharacterized protein n=1 Tax=Aquimarina algiphila TaxID=2047982 RepID=A0A554VKE7_9FLAO|nr:hypothetical protein [Aquimarina algiphila]TSE08512.1 hypothetical protein FOF46_12125 [Aquimarina algiphila]